MDTLPVNRRTLLEFMNGGAGTGHHTAVAALLGEPLAVGACCCIFSVARASGPSA
ncbi:hypothetical protein [uncultured Deinococcus sp.]|uniref:hypothetical protein n=1 Tax=uncultured Deinococcus sp. TaxID=158789 RepID=UPI0025827E3C|nr:hypothetical protein [uncultured Deinococcus sp.]